MHNVAAPQAAALTASAPNASALNASDLHTSTLNATASTTASTASTAMAPGPTAAAPPRARFDLTIVVPTRNEAGNVAELLRRLNGALRSAPVEIVFVDDSDDETPAVILAEAQRSALPVRLIHRPAGERPGRLGGAVVLGFQHAQAPWALVIDGDLQHPPESVPAVVAATRTPDVDLVYGSRYASAGDASGLDGRTRQFVSAWSTRLAKVFFPHRLSSITDPMSGFFAVRLAALDLDTLRPPGYKVLLEILAVSRLRGTVGVPFSFQPRFSGDSKASFSEGVRYLQQLVALRLGTSVAALTRLAAFLAVGLSGVVVNTAVLWALSVGYWHQQYLLASFLATNVAVAWNFVLLEAFVLKKSRKHSPWQGFLRFWALNMMLLPVQLGLLALFVEVLSQNPVAANVLVLTIVFVIRYLATTMWVYESGARSSAARSSAARSSAARSGEEAQHRVMDDREQTVAPAPTLPTASTLPTVPGLLSRGPVPRVALRVGVALAAALLAFPAVGLHVWHLLGGRPLTAAGVVALVAGAAVLVVARAVPPDGDPDVHDRQLDFILALPAMAAALFLAFAWPNRFTAAGPLDDRQVLAFTIFLAGAALLLLGTRCTARLRWVLVAPLLLLPAVGNAPVLAAALVLAFGALAGKALRDARSPGQHPANGRRRPVALVRRERSGAPVTAAPPAPRTPTRLPRWQPTALVVLALAAVLGVLAVSTPAVGGARPAAGATTPAAGAAQPMPSTSTR